MRSWLCCRYLRTSLGSSFPVILGHEECRLPLDCEANNSGLCAAVWQNREAWETQDLCEDVEADKSRVEIEGEGKKSCPAASSRRAWGNRCGMTKNNKKRQSPSFCGQVSVFWEGRRVIELFASAARRLGALTSKDWLKDVGTLLSMTLAERSVERYQSTRLVCNAQELYQEVRVTKTSSGAQFMAHGHTQKEIILHHANRLLGARDFPKTICPSEIARALSQEELKTLGASEWRDTMDDVRQVVWEKRQAGEVEVLEKGEVVGLESLEDIRGPIRVRKVKQ